MNTHQSAMKVLSTLANILAEAINTSLYLLDTVYDDARRCSDDPDCPRCCDDCIIPVFDLDESYRDGEND